MLPPKRKAGENNGLLSSLQPQTLKSGTLVESLKLKFLRLRFEQPDRPGKA